jgi:hypothetical protein
MLVDVRLPTNFPRSDLQVASPRDAIEQSDCLSGLKHRSGVNAALRRICVRGHFDTVLERDLQVASPHDVIGESDWNIEAA